MASGARGSCRLMADAQCAAFCGADRWVDRYDDAVVRRRLRRVHEVRA